MHIINCYPPQVVAGIFTLILELSLLFRGITSVSSTYCPKAPCVQILLGLPHHILWHIWYQILMVWKLSKSSQSVRFLPQSSVQMSFCEFLWQPFCILLGYFYYVSTVHTKYTILAQYWATFCDAGPELKHWIDIKSTDLTCLCVWLWYKKQIF